MGAIATTAGQSGPRSATCTVPTSNGSDTVSNAELLDICSEGPLKDLLKATYVDNAAFATAAAAAGLAISQFGSVQFSALNWAIAGNSAPTLAVTAGAVGVAVLKLSVSHSITQ